LIRHDPEEKHEIIVSSIKKVTLIDTPDPIVNELNSAIETILTQAGIQVLNWEKVKNEIEQKSKTTDAASASSDMEIAIEGSNLLKLDAIIETQMRYTYKSYGGDIWVHFAHLRIVQPSTGQVLFSTQYNIPESTFIRCKQKISGDVLNALKHLK
jgi:hypothetical protein